MIAANELRIGNWVHHNAEWSNRQPEGAGSAFPLQEFNFQWGSSDWYALGEGMLSLEDVEPIPLAEEWLLRFGFHKSDPYKDRFETGFNEGNYSLMPVGDVYSHWYFYHKDKLITTYIRYVHQLQNLYFALTGKELGELFQ